MGKVILICGKICSGKSYYARQLKSRLNAVILSTDEATYDLINNEQGEFYNIFAEKVNRYLRKKAVEIALAGADVILDWGFWSGADRTEISAFLESHNVPYEWHYIDVSDDIWRRNIAERNARISAGEPSCDFYVDDGLLAKLLSLFEVPEADEIDVWYKLQR
ncbi:MAG: ATP-binding protein [Ruminococcus flavefaciens]|nr:ATP-binding protein [Ruminococcus flavefaciens]MCM1231082.1 ATP-binding protein [Ruminococcus flavefaciens]